MNGIKITLVRTVDGLLVGKTVSDRWNLATLGIGSIVHDRNQAEVKQFRRALARQGFTLAVERGGSVQEATAAEIAALGPALASAA